MGESNPLNYCRSCQQDFASVATFEYHLPPAHLSSQQERLVHPDESELRTWGLRQDERGRWTMSAEPDGSGGWPQALHLKRRAGIWSARLEQAGLAEAWEEPE